MAIRPTADRTREAIFNILGSRVVTANVLDLFAGTGALGFEAISRGAKAVIFVENDRKALSIITRNIQHLKLENEADVIKLSVLKGLDFLAHHVTKFEIVFLDPPYGKGMVLPVLQRLDEFGTVSQDAVIVVEHASTESIQVENGALQLYDQRRYGNSLVSFLSHML